MNRFGSVLGFGDRRKPGDAPHSRSKFLKCWMAQGLCAALEATMRIKGLLEMMFDVLSGWIDQFILDMEACFPLFL